MGSRDDLIEHAEQVADLAHSLGTQLLVIGAAALAGHHYVRMTLGLDLAGNLPINQLRSLQQELKRKGYLVELRLPDGLDPLGVCWISTVRSGKFR